MAMLQTGKQHGLLHARYQLLCSRLTSAAGSCSISRALGTGCSISHMNSVASGGPVVMLQSTVSELTLLSPNRTRTLASAISCYLICQAVGAVRKCFCTSD